MYDIGIVKRRGVSISPSGMIFGRSSAIAAPNNTALDGKAKGTPGAALTIVATLTTTQTNDIIVLVCEHNGGLITVADVAGLTWTQLVGAPVTSQVGGGTDLWYAKSSGVLTADVITVTANSSTYMELHVFGVSGTNFASPLDGNGSLPAMADSGALTMSTSNANDFLIAGFRDQNSAGSGWAAIYDAGSDFLHTQYKIVTATQSSLTVLETGADIHNGALAHALVSS